MSTSILPSWWTPSGLKSAQDALLAKAQSDNADIQTCASLSDADKSAWSSFYVALEGFCKTDFGWLTTTNPDGSWVLGGGTGETADQLQSYQSQLFAWETKVQSSCKLSQPVVNPGVNAGTDALVSVVKYGAIGASFLASAYVVSKLAGAFESHSAASAYKADLRDRRRARKRLRI